VTDLIRIKMKIKEGGNSEIGKRKAKRDFTAKTQRVALGGAGWVI